MAVFTVTTAADSGPGSLREAIDLANAAPDQDSIVFDPSLAGQTITLTGGPLTVTQGSVAISGDLNGDGNADISISSTGPSHHLTVASGAFVTLVSLHFLNGQGGGTQDGAGSIVNNGNLAIEACSFRNNSFGGDFSGTVRFQAGAILNNAGGTILIQDSEFRDNTVTASPGEGSFGLPGALLRKCDGGFTQ